jgi:integrase
VADDEEAVAFARHVVEGSRPAAQWVVPYLGNRPIAAIEAPELLEMLKRIEAKGIAATAHRTRAVCGRVFRYAIATGRATRDISADLRGALAPRTTTNQAAIRDPAKIGELLRAIDGYDGQPTTAAALKIAPHAASRSASAVWACRATQVMDAMAPMTLSRPQGALRGASTSSRVESTCV